MKKHLVSILLVLSTYFAVGQNENGSRNIVFNASYPVPIGDNFLARPSDKSFNKILGIYALGLGYHYEFSNNLFLCLDIRYSYLYRQEKSTTNTNTQIQPIPSINLDILNPSIGIKYNGQMGNFSLIPQLNLGYSLFRFYRNVDEQSSSYYASNNAFTISTQMKLAYNLSEKKSLGLFLAYDNSFLDKPKLSAETSFNRRNQWVQFLYPGLEFIIRI